MTDGHVRVIAEAATCHGGDFRRALDLVELASHAGADGIKFQQINPELLYAPRIHVDGTAETNPVIAQRKRELLTDAELVKLREHADACGIEFLLTIFDLQSIDLVKRLGLRTVKIASGDLTFLPLVRAVLKTGIQVLLSTGMSPVAEVEQVVSMCREDMLENLTLLHCTSVYPCPSELANLRRIHKLMEIGLPVGYSDHTLGSWASCAAVAMGATTIEKHVRLSDAPRTADFEHSMTEEDFGDFVLSIRNVARATGPFVDQPSVAESSVKLRARRGLYAKADLKAGQSITLDDIDFLRPPTDLDAMSFYKIIGMRLVSDIARGNPILLSNLLR